MEYDDLERTDLREMDEWRSRNQAERSRMVDEYATRLKARGRVVVVPRERDR